MYITLSWSVAHDYIHHRGLCQKDVRKCGVDIIIMHFFALCSASNICPVFHLNYLHVHLNIRLILLNHALMTLTYLPGYHKMLTRDLAPTTAVQVLYTVRCVRDIVHIAYVYSCKGACALPDRVVSEKMLNIQKPLHRFCIWRHIIQRFIDIRLRHESRLAFQ